jgi:hypothetical protein
MLKKIFIIFGMATPMIIHFIVMSFILVLVLLNIKYGVESVLMSTNYFYLVDSIYEMVYTLYLGSLISFTVLYSSYLFFAKVINNRKRINTIEG